MSILRTQHVRNLSFAYSIASGAPTIHTISARMTPGILWLSALLVSQAQSSFPEATVIAPSNPLVFRRLVGDWEYRRTVLLVYSPMWRPSLTRMATAIGRVGETVVLVPTEYRSQAIAWRADLGLAAARVRLVDLDTNSPWIRDFGPLLVETSEGRPKWLDAKYYEDRRLDNAAPERLARLFGAHLEPLSIDLEGGAIVGDGHGLCVMTAPSWIGTGAWTAPQSVVDRLLHQLGCASLAIVPALQHDPTQHVDMFVQFVEPGVALVGEVARAESFEDHRRMELTVAAIHAAGKAMGRELIVHRAPLPIIDGRFYRTYINGLRFNGIFLAPAYADMEPETERAALAALRRAMPGVDVVPIPALDMIFLDGAVHCISLAIQERLPTLKPFPQRPWPESVVRWAGIDSRLRFTR